MLIFTDVQQLQEWLNSNNINTALWIDNGSRTVHSLWNEIIRGESQIEANPPQRVIYAVSIIIRRNDKILIEGQHFSTPVIIATEVFLQLRR